MTRKTTRSTKKSKTNYPRIQQSRSRKHTVKVTKKVQPRVKARQVGPVKSGPVKSMFKRKSSNVSNLLRRQETRQSLLTPTPRQQYEFKAFVAGSPISNSSKFEANSNLTEHVTNDLIASAAAVIRPASVAKEIRDIKKEESTLQSNKSMPSNIPISQESKLLLTPFDYPYDKELGCDFYNNENTKTAFVPTVTPIWTSPSGYQPPFVALSCSPVAAPQDVAKQLQQLRQIYANTVADMIGHQLLIREQYDELMVKQQRLDAWLQSLKGSEPDFNLAIFAKDTADMEETLTRQLKDVKAAVDALQSIAKFEKQTGLTKQKQQQTENKEALLKIMKTEYAGVAVGIDAMKKQWKLVLNKVKFHMVHLLPTLYSTAEIKDIESSSGYQLPSGWRKGMLLVTKTVNSFYNRAWRYIQNRFAAMKKMLTWYNFAGVLMFAVVIISLSSAASAVAGGGNILGFVAMQLVEIPAWKTFGGQVLWLSKWIQLICQFVAEKSWGVVFLLWFFKDFFWEVIKWLSNTSGFLWVIGKLFSLLVKALSISTGGFLWFAGYFAKPIAAKAAELTGNLNEKEKTSTGTVYVACVAAMIFLIKLVVGIMGGWVSAGCNVVKIAGSTIGIVGSGISIVGNIFGLATETTSTLTKKLEEAMEWIEAKTNKTQQDPNAWYEDLKTVMKTGWIGKISDSLMAFMGQLYSWFKASLNYLGEDFAAKLENALLTIGTALVTPEFTFQQIEEEYQKQYQLADFLNKTKPKPVLDAAIAKVQRAYEGKLEVFGNWQRAKVKVTETAVGMLKQTAFWFSCLLLIGLVCAGISSLLDVSTSTARQTRISRLQSFPVIVGVSETDKDPYSEGRALLLARKQIELQKSTNNKQIMLRRYDQLLQEYGERQGLPWIGKRLEIEQEIAQLEKSEDGHLPENVSISTKATNEMEKFQNDNATIAQILLKLHTSQAFAA